jgi:Concanavalin A-like lectin/glucanases superfamily
MSGIVSISKPISYSSPTPITIASGCTLWLDGADPAGTGTPPSNGATVSTWVDKSGNGLTVSAGSGQPTYVTNAANGLGTVSFNGSQGLNKASVTGANILGGTGSSATFCVFSVSNNTQNSCPFSWDDSGYTYRFMITWAGAEGTPGLEFDLGNFPCRTQIATTGASSINFTNNTYYLVSFWQSGTTTVLNVNGKTYTSIYSDFSNNWSTSASRIFNIGTYVNSASYNMKGNTAEILVYNTNISANFQKIEGYLAWKWGLQSSLQPSHPYSIATLSKPPPIVSIPGFIQSPFLPTAVNGLVLWLDANDPSSVIGTNPITQWTDKSGLGNSALPGAGPIYTADAQSRRCMTFTGTQWLESACTVPTSTHSLFAVYAPTYINGSNGSGGTYGGNSSLFRFQVSNYIVFPYYATGDKGYISNYGTAVTLPENTAAATATLINANIAATTQFVYKNGTQQSSGTYTLTAATSPSLTIGRYTPGQNENYQGFVYEMLVFNTTLSTPDRVLIEGYLANKWNIQGSLSNAHIYTSSPPVITSKKPIQPIVGIPRPLVFILLSSGLLARYRMNESSGSTVIDSIAGNNITIGGSPSRVSTTYGTYSGYALSIQNATQYGYITLPSNMVVGAHSITSWVYFTGFASAAGTQSDWVGWGASATGENHVAYNTGSLTSLFGGPSFVAALNFLDNNSFTVPAQLNTWYFCVTTWNGSSTWKTYCYSPTTAYAFTYSASMNTVTSSSVFAIGCANALDSKFGGSGYGGYIGEVRFYNRAITATEVASIYAGTG